MEKYQECVSSSILNDGKRPFQIADVRFWADIVSKSKNPSENESEHSELPPLVDVETNVYSFGILMLETISGKLPYSEEQGLLMNWVRPFTLIFIC